jgi:thiamine-phosphate pyrophosphorylase
MTRVDLPRLYPILERSRFSSIEQLRRVATLWINADLRILQYRNKLSSPRESLGEARELVRIAYSLHVRDSVKLIMNDRADVCLAADFDGVHVGQDDLTPAGARTVLGHERMIGVSCHNERQIEAAEQTDADYLAIGPMFPTASKENPDPVVGIDRLRGIRKLTSKSLVAIGGITSENAPRVWDAGADSVAVISDLLRNPERDLKAWLNLLKQ